MKQQTVIERALPIVAAAYARKFGISIGIGGDEAYTNGNHVQLPEIPHNSPYQKAIWGFLAHEAGHLRDTNFDLVFTSEYIHGLWNALEDGRTEEAFIRDFPGAKETLDEALNYFISIGKMDFVDVNEHPASILSTYILYWVRAEWRKQDMLKEHFASAQKA